MNKNTSLHGLRGLAMAAVFCHHLYDAAWTGGFLSAVEPGGMADFSLRMMRMSIDGFFLLSGLLIPPCLARQGGALRFLWNRVTRIYPTFLVPHLLVFIVGPLIGYKWMAGIGLGPYLTHFFSNLLFLPGIFDLPIAQGVAWSLSYELAFYLFAAVAYALSNWRGHIAIRSLAWIAWTGGIAWTLSFHPQGWYFVAGVAVYFLEQPGRNHWFRCTQSPLFGLVAMAAMCVLYEWSLPLSVCCGLMGLLGVARQQGLLSWLLQAPPLQVLAEISYSFYLWHTQVMFVTKRIFGYNGGLIPNTALNFAAFSIVTLGLTLVVTGISYSLMEQRCTGWLQKRRVKPAPAPAWEPGLKAAA